MEEIWKDIPGYEGTYQVSNHGHVKRLPYIQYVTNQYGEYKTDVPERMLTINHRGLTNSVVLLTKQHYVDRLVVVATFQNILYENITTVIHLDNDACNNHLDNLEPVLNTSYADDNWKTCPMYPNYEVSYEGHVRCKAYDSYFAHMGNDIVPHHYAARLPKIHITDDGYMNVSIRIDNNKSKDIGVHRLVAMTWLSTWDEALTVNHKDGNKFNNCVDNLEMMTQSENSNHYNTAECFEDSRKLRKVKLSKALKGRTFTAEQRAHMSESKVGKPIWLSDPSNLTPEVRAMLRRNAETAPGFIKRRPCKCVETGQEFASCIDAARFYGVDNSTIIDWCNKGQNKRSRLFPELHFEWIESEI